MKICKTCGESKELDEYSKHPNNRDRLQRACKPCSRAAAVLWKAENREKLSAYNKEYRKDNIDAINARTDANKSKIAARMKAWGERTKDRRKQVSRDWQNNNLEKVAEKSKRWKNSHPDRAWHILYPGKANDKTAKRRAGKLRATPGWADKDKILDFYKDARRSGDHVDHIVPLRSKIVCGLHCEHNLQLLPPSDNLKKSNAYWPDMP